MEKITYTKIDIIKKVSKNLSIPKEEIKIILESILDTVSDIMCEEEYLSRIEIRNFGIFEVKLTKAKPKARNPKKPDQIIYIPPRLKTHFRPGKLLKSYLRQPLGD